MFGKMIKTPISCAACVDRRLKQRRNYDVNERRAHHPKLKCEAKLNAREIQLFSVVRTFSLLYHQNPNVSVTFWFLARVVWMENHLYVLWHVSTRHSLSLGLFMLSSLCQRPIFILSRLSSVLRSVFIALFPFWESYFSISPYIPGEWNWVEEKLLK